MTQFCRRESVEEVEEGENEEEIEEEVAVARSAPCLGCPANMDVDSIQVKELANFTLSALEDAANCTKVQSILRITKATSQVCVDKDSSNRFFKVTISLAGCQWYVVRVDDRTGGHKLYPK